jgi:TP901 family phage tail tape measure protein
MATFLSHIGIRAFVDLGNARAGFATMRREALMTTGALTGLSRSAAAATNPITGFARALNTAGGNVRTFGNLISNLGLRMSALVSAPIILTEFLSVRDAAKFEREMVRTINLAGETASSVHEASREILGMASAVGQLPIDLMEAFFFVASSGLPSTTDFLDITTKSAMASAVGLGDVVEVGNLVTSIIRTFGITAEEALDQTIVAIQEGKAEVEDFTGTMGRALAFAELMGVSFAEFLAAVSGFTQFGVDASVATTGFRAAMTSLMNPTSMATDTLNEFGFSVEQIHDMIADPNIGLAKTLLTLDKKFEGSSVVWGRVIGNVRGLAEVLSLVGLIGEEDYLNLVSKIQNSNGVLEESFERVTKTLEFQVMSLKAAGQALSISIGDALKPLAFELVQKLVPFVQAMQRWVELHPGFVQMAAVFGAIVAAMGPLLFLFGAFVATLGTLVTAVSVFVATFGSVALFLSGAFTLAVTGVVGILGILVGALITTAGDIQRKAGPAFESVAQKALRWGQNIIISLANGIIRGITAVINALATVAGVFTYWLRGSSPPRLLPHLTDWGEQAVNAWLEGWTHGNFSLFKEITEPVEDLIRAVGGASGAERTGIASLILGSREAIDSAIMQYRELGRISDETMQQIVQGTGAAAQVIPLYIQSLVDLEKANERVAAAQERLNEITARYEERLRPLNDRMRQIRDTQDEWQRQQRETELGKILVDRRAPEFVKDRARLLLEELNLERQIAAIEAERDSEVSAAEMELQLAEEQRAVVERQIEATRDLIDLIVEQNRLMAETIELQKELAEDTAGGGGDGGGAVEGGDLDIPTGGAGVSGLNLGDLPTLDTEALKTAWANIKAAIAPSLAELQVVLDRFSTAIANLIIAFDEFKGNPQQFFVDALDDINKKLSGGQPLPNQLKDLAKSIKDIYNALKLFDAQLGASGEDPLSLLIQNLTGFDLSTLALDLHAALVDPVTDFLAQSPTWATFVEVLNADLTERLPEGYRILGGVIQQGADNAGRNWNSMKDNSWRMRTELSNDLDALSRKWELFKDSIEEIGKELKRIWDELKENFWKMKTALSNDIDEIKRWFEELPGKIETALSSLGAKIGAAFTAAKTFLLGPNGPVQTLVNDVINSFSGMISSIATALGIENWGSVTGVMTTLATNMISAFARAFSPTLMWEHVKNVLNNLKQQIEDWVKNLIFGFVSTSGPPGGSDEPPQQVASPVQPGVTAMVVAPPISGGSSTAMTLNMGGQTINNGLDAATFAALVKQSVARSI